MLETEVRVERTTPYRPWVAACAAAEAVGMTAAAGAAVLADTMSSLAALMVVIAGGLVEGTALGLAQGTVLARVAPRLSRARYLVATVLVAGLGWAAASAPSVVGGGDAEQPPVLLVALGGAALGLVLGSVLGAAQAWALRGAVRHPRRWVVANAAAWPGAMALIMVGATTPDAGWPVGGVLVTAVVTGAVAGSALGLVSGLFLPTPSGVVGLQPGGAGAPRLAPADGVAADPDRPGCARSGLRAPVPPPGPVLRGAGRARRGARTTLAHDLVGYVPSVPATVGVFREGARAPGSARCLGPGDPVRLAAERLTPSGGGRRAGDLLR